MRNVLWMPRALAAVATVASGLHGMTVGAVAQSALPDRPLAIICYAQGDGSWRVGYLQRIESNGDALYISADRQLGATVDAKGEVLTPTDRAAGLDCYGKNLDELRSGGRTIEFQHPK